jgi:outer membrane immunogenic protein
MHYLERTWSGERRTAARWALSAGTLLAASIGFATPALAQSDDTPFTGFKVEAITGYDDEGVDFNDDVFGGGKNSQSGWMYGIGVGYDYQTGPWVFGAEGEWSDSTASRDETLSGLRPANPIAGVPLPTAVTTSLEGKAGADIYIGARAGYTVMPNFLVYLKGGWSFSKIEIDGAGTDNGVPFTFDEHVSVDGFRLGVGGEYQVTPNIYVKGEYRYSNYNNGDLDVRGSDVNLDPLFSGIDIVRHQFVVGVGFRF